jgi:hypothetical protein
MTRTELEKAANAFWKSEGLSRARGAIAYDAFLAGAAWQREQIRAEIIEWLDCTGAIPKGTSYYAELLGCTESSSSNDKIPRCPKCGAGYPSDPCTNCEAERASDECICTMGGGEHEPYCETRAQNENARKCPGIDCGIAWQGPPFDKCPECGRLALSQDGDEANGT